ncbi:MAG: GNAT family N-acetyltransferase [Bacillaceae bacterium]
MKLYVKQMSMEEARQIATWTYEKPYTMYSMDEACIPELLQGDYFAVTNSENKLIGYYCFGESAQVPAGRRTGAYVANNVVDVGLGINPELCGRGLGFEFLNKGLQFARNELDATKFRLTVAAFNQRGINVYERVGFKKVYSFQRISEMEAIDFFVMVLE